jgi:hypothetical protein
MKDTYSIHMVKATLGAYSIILWVQLGEIKRFIKVWHIAKWKDKILVQLVVQINVGWLFPIFHSWLSTLIFM